jgi:hypothetical protein
MLADLEAETRRKSYQLSRFVMKKKQKQKAQMLRSLPKSKRKEIEELDASYRTLKKHAA